MRRGSHRSGIGPFLLGLVVPGLGHIYQGRRGKGILFLAAILGAWVFGWGITGGEAVSSRRHPLTIAAQAGAAGPTAVALLASRGREERRWIEALVRAGPIREEQADRIPRGLAGPALWGYLRGELRIPQEDLAAAFRESSRRADPRLDIGVLYVMVAGLLNLLVAADAAVGRRPPASEGREDR